MQAQGTRLKCIETGAVLSHDKGPFNTFSLRMQQTYL